jgi:hypothetical protein
VNTLRVGRKIESQHITPLFKKAAAPHHAGNVVEKNRKYLRTRELKLPKLLIGGGRKPESHFCLYFT